MQQAFYAANPDPEAFWTSTFEEVYLVIKGYIDGQRIARRNAHRIHETYLGTDKALSIFDFNPLPYDEELQGEETGLSDEQLYALLRESGYFSTPLNS